MATTAAPPAGALDRYDRISIDLVDPSPLNPRKRVDGKHIADLERSIQARGEVLVPLLVRDSAGGRFELIDGERRWRALKHLVTCAGDHVAFHTVRAVVRNLSNSEVLEIQLISAIQRQDLTPLEEAAGYTALIASNPARYSAAYIADKIGRSEKYVLDRMRLLDAIAPVQQLLNDERILVGHAELLAKLKPEDQQRAIAITRDRLGARDRGGLWQIDSAELDFADAGDTVAKPRDRYAGFRAVTVAQLQAWVSKHVRFDAKHMATTAPLEFGVVGELVAAAQAQPGPGRKVVSITFEHQVTSDAKDPSERTYGFGTWKRADGTKQSQWTFDVPRRRVDSPACDHAVLGVVAVGEHYGEAFQVCVARDVCAVHWAAEIAEKQKTAKLRARGQGARATQREVAATTKRRAAEEQAAQERAAWKAIEAHILTATIAQVRGAKTVTPAQAKAILESDVFHYNAADKLKKHLGSTWHTQLGAALLVLCIDGDLAIGSFDDYIARIAKPLGLNVKPLEAIRAQHDPADAPTGTPRPRAAARGKR